MQEELLVTDPTLITVNSADILSLLGKSDLAFDRHTSRLVETYIPRCKEIAAPTGGFTWHEPIRFGSKDLLMIDGTRFQVGRIILNEIRNSEACALFAVTVGPGPESLARELMSQGNYLEGYLVDLIASAMVESVADLIHDRIRTVADSRGMKVTNRYSPGYCTWKVDEQQKLFCLIAPGSCGITLTESSLMTPIKSVSGLIGIGSGVTFNAYSCGFCSMKNCMFRKTAPGRQLKSP